MSNDFLPFAIDPSANVATQAAYVADGTYVDGFLSGLAKSALMNKALRQGTFIAAALAQYVANSRSISVNDDGNLAGFITELTAALGNIPGGAAHEIVVQAGAGSTGFVSAPTSPGQTLVWNGTNILWESGSGDTASLGINGWFLSSTGWMVQWSRFIPPGGGGYLTVTLPTSFPTGFIGAIGTSNDAADILAIDQTTATVSSVIVQNGGGGNGFVIALGC